MMRSFELWYTNHKKISVIVPRLRYHPLLLLLLCSVLANSVHCYLSRTHIFIYAGCAQEKYQPNSPFEANLNTFLSSVASSSSEIIYNSFAIGNGTSSNPQQDASTATIYGLFQCRGDLHPIDCSKCIARSVNQIGLVCPYAMGATLQLEGCYLRYEHTGDFLGKIDTGVRFKKCSRSVNNDVEFFRRRDDVIVDLETANGFRVSSSGLVEGFAQCLGDLTVSDCGSCLGDAVGKLKSLCGSAAAADVFLGQCYARYWASGYYDQSGLSNDDQVGKSVAIIVGVFGGLAVLVVLLSICKKTMGK